VLDVPKLQKHTAEHSVSDLRSNEISHIAVSLFSLSMTNCYANHNV
jgi:hypothetical protein